MGKFTTFIGLVIVAIFIYLVVTNQAFLNYVAGALHGGGAISQLPVSSNDITQLLNTTSSMNESQFISWAGQGGGVINPVISKIRGVTNSTAFSSALNKVWAEIEVFRSGGTLSSITAAINRLINASKG